MSRITRIVVVLVLVSFMLAVSQAVEPAYRGPKGNPEEPALRVYKAFWRGLLAFKYQVIRATKEGDQKVPSWGYVQAVRGVRRGAVELGVTTYKGMAGERPGPVEELCKANRYIDKHPKLQTVSDAVPAAAFLSLCGVPPIGAVLGSVPVAVAQVQVDREEQRRLEAALDWEVKPVPEMFVFKGEGRAAKKQPAAALELSGGKKKPLQP